MSNSRLLTCAVFSQEAKGRLEPLLVDLKKRVATAKYEHASALQDQLQASMRALAQHTRALKLLADLPVLERVLFLKLVHVD